MTSRAPRSTPSSSSKVGKACRRPKVIASPAWFTNSLGGVVGSKDNAIQNHGALIVELGELDQHTTPRDHSRIKGYTSLQTDRYRPVYGKNAVNFPRQCVFGATTNKLEYLPDETGNRRYWPLRCRAIDIPRLTADRIQLLGEAVQLYMNGEPWWLDTPRLNALAAAEQDKRFVQDPWHDPVAEFLDSTTPPFIAVGQILRDAIGIDVDRLEQKNQNRIAAILAKLQWVPGQSTLTTTPGITTTKKRHGYFPPGHQKKKWAKAAGPDEPTKVVQLRRSQRKKQR